jgi:hypothetical protein
VQQLGPRQNFSESQNCIKIWDFVTDEYRNRNIGFSAVEPENRIRVASRPNTLSSKECL